MVGEKEVGPFAVNMVAMLEAQMKMQQEFA